VICAHRFANFLVERAVWFGRERGYRFGARPLRVMEDGRRFVTRGLRSVVRGLL
jgi:hypothetical protein